MITYVNTVLVGTKDSGIITEIANDDANKTKKVFMVAESPETDKSGSFVVVDAETGKAVTANSKKIKIGMVTKKTYDLKGDEYHIVKWTNPIQKDAIKSFSVGEYVADTQEKIEIDFTTSSHLAELAKGGKRVVLRLTFKDLPTKYRKWSESYEYVTKKIVLTSEELKTATTEAAQDALKEKNAAIELAKAMKKQIDDNYKRARVKVTANAGVLTLTAMPYSDDNMKDSISWDNTVRFSANVWYTDPDAKNAFASKNKYGLGATITKTPGKKYQASAKIVRDREAMGMGYLGILNRGECTWPVIKPEMNVEINGKYDYMILEWENMYRTADDLQRRTKECVEIYPVSGTCTGVKTAIETFINGTATHSIPVQTVINDNND